MKKIFTLILTIVFICSCSIIASAAEAKYNTAGELYEAWCENLPDYICGVWSTDGGANNLTFGIQDNANGNAGKQEMLSLVKNDSTLTFVYQEYSRNYLLQIQREIDEYMKKELGLISTALNEQNNCVELGILKERKDDVATQDMIKEIADRYGNAVTVEYTDEIFELTIGEEQSLQSQHFLFYTMGIIAVLLVGMFFVFQKRNVLLLQTNNGATVSATTYPSTKEVENLVRKTQYDIPSELDQRIMSEINKTE